MTDLRARAWVHATDGLCYDDPAPSPASAL